MAVAQGVGLARLVFRNGRFDGGVCELGYAGGEVGEEFGELGVYLGERGDVRGGDLAVRLRFGDRGCGGCFRCLIGHCGVLYLWF